MTPATVVAKYFVKSCITYLYTQYIVVLHDEKIHFLKMSILDRILGYRPKSISSFPEFSKSIFMQCVIPL